MAGEEKFGYSVRGQKEWMGVLTIDVVGWRLCLCGDES